MTADRAGQAADPTTGERVLTLVGVRRWGEENTPIVIGGRHACGTWSDHARAGCIGIEWSTGQGTSGLLHLTPDDALRLSDLLRAMTEATR